MKHTQPPWFAEQIMENNSGLEEEKLYVTVGPPTGQVIAECDPFNNFYGTEIRQANLKLIAAAPLLLESMEAMVKSITAALSNDPPRDWQDSLADALECGREAISAATSK